MYPFTFFSISKENIYFFFHRILWLSLYFPSIKIRRLLLIMFGAKVDKNVSLLIGLKVIAPWKLSLGSNTTINSNVTLDCRGGVKIGNNVMIGRNSSIHSVGHSYKSNGFIYFESNVNIDDDVLIYPNVFIGPSICISKGTVVLPNSWVKNNTNEYDVICGVPAIKLENIKRKVDYTSYNPSIFGI
jgi:putative colanic acid biosynthesis acetyltransferase WcaF